MLVGVGFGGSGVGVGTAAGAHDATTAAPATSAAPFKNSRRVVFLCVLILVQLLFHLTVFRYYAET